jgi:hypothetical protein
MANMVIEAKAQDVNFVTKFEADVQHLLNVLGKTSVQVVAPGTAVKIYETSGSLSTATVAEKALIPDSEIEVGDPTVVEVTYNKYRNLTGIESIGKYGYEIAVGKTNEDMLKQVQNKIRQSIFAGLATGTATATGATFQAAIAAAAAKVAEKFEAEVATPVFFVNPADLYTYLGTHNVTLESEFGLNYLKNFMGIGNVVADTNVEAGKIYGTAIENLTVVAPSVAQIPGMDMTTDASGIIAVRNDALYENAAIQTVAYCGLGIHPAFLDRIVKSTIAGE